MDEYLVEFDQKERCFVAGDSSSTLTVKNISNDLVDFDYEDRAYSFSFNKLFGRHHYLNFLNCFSLVVDVFNIEPKKVLDSAKDFKLGAFRGEWRRIKNFDCFLDCYNSNPSSLKASMDSFLAEYKTKVDETLFVIGDMYELGEESDRFHELAGKYFRDHSLNNIIFIGEKGEPFQKGLGKKIKHFKNVDDVSFSQLELTGISTLYLKGSRGVQLEKLLEIFNK